MKIVEAVFQNTKMFSFFLMWTTLNCEGRSKKKETANICKGTPDIEFEQDWSVAIGATLGDGQKIKYYFSSFRDFFRKSQYCRIVRIRMYYKPTKFNQNRWSHFWENQFFKFFIKWTTLNFKVRVNTKTGVRDICERTLDIDFERDWWVGLGPALRDGKN